MAPPRSASSAVSLHSDPSDAAGRPALSPTPGPGPRKRRRRIPVACTACRHKKTRSAAQCDGERPICATCQAQGIECEYAENANLATATVSKALVARLVTLERDVRILKSHSTTNDELPPQRSQFLPRRGEDSITVATEDIPQSNNAIIGDDEDGVDEESVVSPDVTDGVGTIEFAGEEDSAYFGPSSNIAFIRIIRCAIAASIRDSQPPPRILSPQRQHEPQDGDRETGGEVNSDHRNAQSAYPNHHLQPQHLPLHHQHPHQHSTLLVSRPPSPTVPSKNRKSSSSQVYEGLRTGTEQYHMPSEDETLRLCERFFSNAGLLFPYVHEETFWQNYRAARTTSSPGSFRRFRQTWVALLNMVLAMATATSTAVDDMADAAERAARAEMFFLRAKRLCLHQMIAGASVEIVQVVLLMTQYLQGTQRSLKTWTIHGLAVKAALQLGLHSQDALSRLQPLDREIRIRTWYACVVLDRTLSTTLGRPCAIPENYITVSLPSHFLPSSGPELVPWSCNEDSTWFWNATINLYRISSTLVDTLYGSNLGVITDTSFADLASSIIQVEQQLLLWQTSLPDSLKLVQADELPRDGKGVMPVHLKLRVVLTLRFMHLRLLAHRPILDQYLRQLLAGMPQQTAQETSMLVQYGHRSKIVCFETAESLIGIASAVAHSGQLGFLGAWWFSLHYTFSAAIVILGILICDATISNPNQSPSEPCTARKHEALDKAISCLPLLNRGNRMAEKCAKFTVALWHCVQGLRQSRRSRVPSPGALDIPLADFDFSNFGFDFTSFDMNYAVPGVVDTFEANDLMW